jgi:hypothetical protein
VLTNLTGGVSTGQDGRCLVFVQHLANTPAKTDKPPIGCASRSRFCRLWHECQAVGMVRMVNLDSDPGSTKQTTLTTSTSEAQGGLPQRVPQQG